jgi:type II secretion system protein I
MIVSNIITRNGFALVEVLVALVILSVVILSLYSGLTTGLSVISGARGYTRAMIIADNRMQQFILEKKKGPDMEREPSREFEGYTVSRNTVKFEHPLLGQLPARKTTITVRWEEKGVERSYDVFYIYPEL